ncbi:MAG: M48 family metalloprotease [Desulfovibrio sp.]|jgi:putative metalloprotease|nr:M48 family metalloprotease [Desulfovibrio sp.]
MTLKKEDVAAYASQMIAASDAEHKMPKSGSSYDRRLKKIIKTLGSEIPDSNVNFKIYVDKTPNASASPDGSIRINTGLFDIMTDDEVLFVLGHELGHYIDGDTVDKMKASLIASAVLKATTAVAENVGGNAGTIVALTRGQAGELLKRFTESQFSQKQEYDADKYGYQMMLRLHKDPRAAMTGLSKLSNYSSLTAVIAMASHPATSDRVAAIERMIEGKEDPKKKSSDDNDGNTFGVSDGG